MEEEKKLLVKLLKKNKVGLNSAIKAEPKSILKSAEESEQARKEGNALYMQSNHTDEDHQEIFKLYSKSVALAPLSSHELATAYYNKSAFLMHVGKYKSCIEDLDKALNITNSNALRIKLLCRKTRCFYKLDKTKKHGILNEIKSLLEEIPENSKDKVSLKKLYDDTVSYLNPKNFSIVKENPILNRFDIDFPNKDKQDIYESITVRYHEKTNSRYLTANKNFAPGEVIYVEPFYAACLNYSKTYTHCQNCLMACWSGIPCDYCNWAMFCSDDCKNEAMEKFHDAECQLIPQIFNLMDGVSLITYRTTIRMLIMAIKEAGGIKKLRCQLKITDKTLGSNPHDIYMAEKVPNSFTSVYSLKMNFRAILTDLSLLLLPKMSVYFIKFSKFFDKLDSVDDILKDGDMMFVVTLLARIQKIQSMNDYVIDIGTENCKHPDESEAGNKDKIEHRLDCTRGTAFALVDNFIGHSCAPNVRRLITEKKRIIIYAIRPIKKDTKLFECLFQPYFLASRDTRRKNLKKMHQIKCKCEACVNDWTSVMTNPLKTPRISDKEHEFSSYLSELQAFTMVSLIMDKPNFNEYIEKISKHLQKACKELNDPACFTIYTLISMLQNVFENTYGMNYETLKCY